MDCNNRINRGHDWFLLAIIAINVTFTFGVVFSFGALYITLLDTFNENRSITALVQSILAGITLTFGIVSGMLVSRFGVRNVSLLGSVLASGGFISAYFSTSILYIILQISVVSGIGISLLYVSATVSVGRIFHGKKKPMALSMLNATVSLAGLFYPSLMNWIREIHGLYGTFLILGGIYLHFYILPILYSYEKRVECMYVPKTPLKGINNIDNSEDEPMNKEHITIKFPESTIKDETHSCLPQIATTPFILLVFAAGIAVASLNSFMVIVVDIFVWKGHTTKMGLFAFIPINVCGFIGRMLPGLIKQIHGVDLFVLPVLFSICGLIGCIVLYFVSDYNYLMVGSGIIGIAVGGSITAVAVGVVDIVGDERLGIGFGMILTVTGVFTSTGGPFYGYLRDKTGSYSSVLLCVAVFQFTGALLFVGVLIARRCKPSSKFSMKRSFSVYIVSKD